MFVQSEVILNKSILFLDQRIIGLIFAYVGLALVSLYIGIKRPKFILIDTVILCSLNIVLGYLLVFGKHGFPEMGIAGAGLASAISEIVAFVVFLTYMIFDKELHKFQLWKIPHFEFSWIKTINSISFTILLQSLLAIGSWFCFLLHRKTRGAAIGYFQFIANCLPGIGHSMLGLFHRNQYAG